MYCICIYYTHTYICKYEYSILCSMPQEKKWGEMNKCFKNLIQIFTIDIYQYIYIFKNTVEQKSVELHLYRIGHMTIMAPSLALRSHVQHRLLTNANQSSKLPSSLVATAAFPLATLPDSKIWGSNQPWLCGDHGPRARGQLWCAQSGGAEEL